MLTPFEMLVVNLFVIDSCSEKKYSRRVTYAIMGVFTAALLLVAYLISRNLPDFGSGNGLFVFSGFLFAFPIKLLYRNSVAKIISLACTSWVYTFLLFSISVHIGYMLPWLPLHYRVLVVQTVLYLVTFVWFYRLLRYKFLAMLAQLSPKDNLSLMWMGIIWFWTVFIVNLAFIYTDIYVFRVLAIVSVGACALNFYRYIYRLINSHRTIQTLEQIAYHDDLTQLRSRVLLSSDVDELISRGLPFHLIFMDLNRFKSVNDNYGHQKGDEYLAVFAREVKLRLGSRGGFYRISGDEFVCIFTEAGVQEFEQAIAALPAMLPGLEVPFLGVSYGTAAFPADGATLDELIATADKRMYVMKHGRTKSGRQPGN